MLLQIFLRGHALIAGKQSAQIHRAYVEAVRDVRHGQLRIPAILFAISFGAVDIVVMIRAVFVIFIADVRKKPLYLRAQT